MLKENYDLDQTQDKTSESVGVIGCDDALENYRTNTDWWIVFDAFDLPKSVGSALWIAGRTGLSVETVNEALEGLVVLGLAKRTEKGYEKIKDILKLSNEKQSKSDMIEEHALISRQVLNHLNEGIKGAMRFGSFASNHSIIRELYERIDKAIYEADEKSKKLNRDQIDNIYLMSFTATSSINFSNMKGDSNV